MKKILFCAAVAALATACTNEDDLVLNQEKGSKGLTFDVSLAENAVTRGELWKDENGTYPFFWYAEQDEISVQSVYAKAVTSGYGNNSTGKGVASFTNLETDGSWTLAEMAAAYKATKSAGSGQFTAKSPEDMLALPEYDDTNAGSIAASTPTIVATYGIGIQSVTSNTTGTTKRQVPGSLKTLVLKTSASNATQAVARPNQVIAPMYSVSSAKKEKAYDSFGEKAQLRMIRPFPVVRFTTKGTEEYIDDLGDLESVKLTMLGHDEEGDAKDVEKSGIVYAESKTYTVIGAGEDGPAGEGFIPESDNNVVTVEVNNGEWTDDDAVYMTVAPVSRKAFRDKGVKEGIGIEYKFTNITFTLNPTREGAADFEKLLVTNNDWSAVTADGVPNAITPLPALDINNYNYLVTETSGEYTLIVIKGTFSGAFKADGNVNWGNGIAKASVKKIRSAVALTAEELAMLKDFTALEELELKANTTIPAKTFSSGQQTTIKKLILPAVTEIKSGFINAENGKFSALTDLDLASYNFPDAAINKSFFESTTGTLKNLNIASVQTMLPTFGVERELSFKGFTELNTVKVFDGVQLSASAFEGCGALAKVTGKVNVTGAVNAFKMTNNTTLKSIEITGTDIPNGAFTNCKALATVKVNGAQVAPTSVGESAFEGCTAIKYMGLADVKTLGKAAFKNAGLVSDAEGSQILTVGAEAITEEALSGTKVVMVDFTNATSIEPKILDGTSATLKQVRFNKVFTGVTQTAGNNWDKTFGDAAANASTVVLFVAAEQGNVNSNKLGLPWYNAGTKTTEYYPYSFKGIYHN